ncbi:hypothetical protein FRC15_000773, partial [Serendipita sp. 397]
MAVVDRADEQADRRMNRRTGLSGWWKLLPFVSRKVPDETWKRSLSAIWTHSARLMKEDGRVDLPLLAIPTCGFRGRIRSGDQTPGSAIVYIGVKGVLSNICDKE